MGYLIFQILFFLLIAALLGFVIGWLLRNARFQTEIKDLDARWRSKLSEVESERDRFAGEVNQANEARARFEASAAEAQRLAETHEASLEQLKREHQSKVSAFADVEQRVGSLEGDLSNRDKELAEARAALARQQTAGGDAEHGDRDLAAAASRAEALERDLQQAKEANGACKREVDRLQARVAELERTGPGAVGGSALGLVGSTEGGTAGEGDLPGGGAGTSGGGTLGLVGGTDALRSDDRASGAGGSGASGSESEPGYRQRAASPSYLADAGGQGFAGASNDAASSGGASEGAGVQPESLSQARGGVADDLKKISGVGPKLEKTLNSLGIYHFSQIAAFTPDNVTWVDRHLRFKGRIEREKWIEQAKILAAGGETEFSRRS